MGHDRRRATFSSSRLGNGARILLAAIRIVNGVLGLFAPPITARQIAEEADARPPAHYPFRLFGVRTILIGADLLSKDGEVRDRAVRLALPIHASDTVSAAVGGLLGELPPRAAWRLVALSGTNTMLALLARRTLP